MLKRSFIRVTIKLPWSDAALQSDVGLDDGVAELWFRARGQPKTERERKELLEERLWRVAEIAKLIAITILNEIAKAEKKRG